MNTTKKRSLKTLVLAMICAALCLVLTGCASSNLQIGSTADKDSFTATNEMGCAITGIAFKNATDQDFNADLEQKGDWDNGTTVDIHFTSQDNATTDDHLVTMRIETADGMSYELHQLDLGAIKDATIYLDGEIAYMEYTNAETGEAVNTLDAEKTYRDQQKAAEEAAAQAAQEQAKAAEDQTKRNTDSTSNTSSNSKSSSSSSSKSSSSGSSSKPSSSNSSSSGNSSSGEDTCVDDLVFN